MARITVLVLALMAIAAVLAQPAEAYNNGVARKPTMGWNTWCTDDLCGLIDKCTDSEIRSVADAMVAQGMDKLGYEYIVMDDCWSDTKRNATGHLLPAASQFPNGMGPLADYVHSKGLKFGLYTCVGTQTCHGGRPGSYGNFDIDAQTVAEWGLDFIKADNCNRPSGSDDHVLYANFSRALNRTGRPILFNTCQWGEDDVLDWGYTLAQQVRVQADHLPFWKFGKSGSGVGLGQGTWNIIEYMATLPPSKYIHQYGWLDPDFLETLFPVTMPFVESRTEYTFWALWSSPLVISTDIRNMKADMAAIVMNPEVIAVDQDDLITAGDRVYNNTDGSQAWSRDLANGDKAVVLYNSGDASSNITVSVTMQQLGWGATDVIKVRNLWDRADAGSISGTLQASLAKHDVMFVRLTNVNKTAAHA